MSDIPQTDIGRVEKLELEIDARLVDLWDCIGVAHVWDMDDVARFVRCAYGQGYTDALRDGGEMCDTHGYKRPEPRA